MTRREPSDRTAGCRRTIVGRTGLSAVALAVCAILPAAAGDAREEVLIGTFELGARPRPQAGAETEEGARTAADIYREAVARLQAGDRPGAQRALEILVVRFPAAREARLARLRLARMYGDLRGAQAGASPERIRPAAGEDAGPATHNTDDGWSAEVRTRRGGIEDRFRMEVGDRVFFSAGSAELGSRARMVLQAQAAWMLQQPQTIAVIEGHADDPGSAEDNIAVARARAEAIRQRLIEEGVAADRLRTAVLGRTVRIADCEGSECAAQNRRSVTVVYAKGNEPPTSVSGRQSGEGWGRGHSVESVEALGPRRARR